VPYWPRSLRAKWLQIEPVTAMSTPDGISTEDWDVVHELAVEIVNANGEREERCRAHLLSYLDELQEKYGERPSILATRADYVGDARSKEELLRRAYALAQARGDGRNALYVAHSLAELYIEEFKDASEGHKWLGCLKQQLVEIDKGWYAEEHDRLHHAAQQLRPDQG